MRGKITYTLLIILAISLIDGGLFVSAQQPPITQESSSPSPELAGSPAPTQSPSIPTAPTSISAKAASGFGLSFEATYTFSSRNLTVNGDVFWAGNIKILITYSVDGSENHTLPTKLAWPYPDYLIPSAYINGSVVLPLLSVGCHSITVYGKWTATMESAPPHDDVELAQATLNFTVRAPVITVFSPENISYPSKDLSVNFTIDEPVSWAGYSLDNQDNVTFTENATLTDLTYRNHTLAVYANDTAGVMGESQTVNFTIKAPPEPFSLLIFVAVTSILAVVIAAIGIVVYRKHHS